MTSIKIKNIGPLKHIDIKLNKVNVFIGPQSIGKSTLAKLISFCNWLQKDCVLRQDTQHVTWQYIEQKLIEYYNLKGYFIETSEFEYENEVLKLAIREGRIEIEKKEEFDRPALSKNAYIPSERNALALPNIFSLKLPNNYLLEFIDDWQEIRENYSDKESLKVLDLGARYYFNENDNRDMIGMEGGADILFSQASSGLQSVIPLCVYIDYLTNWVYTHKENRSAESRKQYRDLLEEKHLKSFGDLWGEYGRRLLGEMSEKRIKEVANEMQDILRKIREKGKNDEEIPVDTGYMLMLLAEIQKIQYELDHPSFTNLVVEEPEQNLFPDTQLQLVYYILSRLEHRKKRDSLILTTHSPYILYALNNCMLASLASREDEEMVNGISKVPGMARISPEIVSVWEIRDGSIPEGKTIQDDRGLILGNYFERVMHNIIADFSNLLSIL